MGPDDMGSEEWFDLPESDRRRADRLGMSLLKITNERDAAVAELEALKAELAKARGLRLGRTPTVEDIRAHGDQGRWLISWRAECIMWEVCVLETDDGLILVDGSEHNACHIVDAIPVDDDDQPCPVGGWGGTP